MYRIDGSVKVYADTGDLVPGASEHEAKAWFSAGCRSTHRRRAALDLLVPAQPALWLQSVAWAALLGTFTTLAGFVVGIVRRCYPRHYRMRSGPSHSPYVGLMKRHHYAGLILWSRDDDAGLQRGDVARHAVHVNA